MGSSWEIEVRRTVYTPGFRLQTAYVPLSPKVSMPRSRRLCQAEAVHLTCLQKRGFHNQKVLTWSALAARFNPDFARNFGLVTAHSDEIAALKATGGAVLAMIGMGIIFLYVERG